jgi:hypothetical protein
MQPRHRTLVWQVVLGFFTWFAAAGLYWFAFNLYVKLVGPGPWWIGWVAPVVAIAGVFSLGYLVQIRKGWRGYMPGMMLGLLLTCLVPVALAPVLCGPMH